MPAGHRAVDRVEHALDPDRGVGQIDQEHAGPVIGLGHDDPDTGPVGPGDIGFAAIDDPVIAVLPAGGQHHRRIRARAVLARRFGHEKGRAGLALDQRAQEAVLQIGAGHLAQ